MRWSLVPLSAALLFGCTLARETPDTHYYTLAVPGTPAARLSAPVRIDAVTADPPYATSPIAYRSSPYRLDYYTYHRWAADPREIVAAAARDYLEKASGSEGQAYEIDAHIRRIEEVDSTGGWEGALELELKVKRGGATLVDRVYSESTAARERSPEAVVAALSRSLGQILDAMLEQVAGSGGSGLQFRPSREVKP